MKSYFPLAFIFLLLLASSWAQPHGSPSEQEEEQVPEETESAATSFDNFQIASNPQLQGLVYIGVQDVTQQAIQDGSLPEGNYQVSEIISAAQNQDNYRFEVQVTDDQGNTAFILFFVSYDSSSGTTQVTSYDVLGNEGVETEESGEVTEVTELGEEEGGEPTEDEFAVLDPSVVDSNPIIRGIIILGVQEITKQAIAEGSLEDSNYQLANVYSIEQGVENPEEYKFDVSVINDLQNTFRVDFDLLYDIGSNSVQILSYSTTPIPNEEGTEAETEIEEAEAEAETEIEEAEAETEIEETEAEIDIEETESEVEAEAEETETEVEETFEETPPIIEEEVEEQQQTEDKFVVLDVSVAQTDTEIVGILNVGVKEAIKQAIANGSLYDSAYELVQVYSVQQNLANLDEYRFNVSVSNSSQVTVIIDFDLIYNESTNTVNVISLGYPNVIIPESGEEIIPPVEEEEENSTGGVYGIPAGYEEIYFDPNDSSTFLFELGDAGLEEVITQGVADGTIPSSYYYATYIYSVSEKVEGSWLYYRFDFYGADGYGNGARFTYIVSYDLTTATPYLEDMQISDVVRVW